MRNINIQVLETKYVINLGQFLKIILDTKIYISKLVKYVQLMQLESIQLEHACAEMAIDHEMGSNSSSSW
jgi:hypothetical protein